SLDLDLPSLHDALPIFAIEDAATQIKKQILEIAELVSDAPKEKIKLIEGGVELKGERISFEELLRRFQGITAGEFSALGRVNPLDRKSTRLNSSHVSIS